MSLCNLATPSVPIFLLHQVARSRLKKALTEFYRSLMFLDSYKNLNEKGFQKILKKFDKTAGWRASQLYTQKMKQYHWVTSEDLNAIIKETETVIGAGVCANCVSRRSKRIITPPLYESESLLDWLSLCSFGLCS
ncbi:SPX domain-containing protein [Dichotomocladium elegans]|nr:SPX domain-containing protein [Dichotomocladium elegans]